MPKLINCKKYLADAAHVVGITFLAILFARFVVYDLMSLSVFAPMDKATDFQMSDIYQSVSESKAIHQLSKDITIVSIDSCDRADVLTGINLISDYSPAAIGLDVFFLFPEQDNSFLLGTFTSIPNLVCAGKFVREPDASTYRHVKQSFYEDSIDVNYGYVNLNASSQRDVIRDFAPYVLTANGDTLLSMPALLAKLYAPKRYTALMKRQHTTETIAFENIEFPIITLQNVLDDCADQSLIAGRIILIGDIHSINDSYLTPLHEPMAGIMLHAYALQTILSGHYIESSPSWFNWFIAIVLCLLFTICNLIAKYRMSNMGNLFVRIVQFAMMYILIVIGCAYFSSHHGYIDFSPAILMIGFGAIAFDVWFGCYALYNLIKSKQVKK